MSILNYEFLDPEVYKYNDEPRVWHNAVGQIVTWEDGVQRVYVGLGLTV